jgi:phosphoribosylformylglycinamidine (FGAM) synthase-like enzyme
MALTNCLNFGNPEKKDVYYQLSQCISGMSRACRELKIPVVSGNVSLYNETMNKSIYPTPVVGMVGLINNASLHCTSGFKKEGDIVILLGDLYPIDNCLAGSEYQKLFSESIKGNVSIDLKLEKKVQRCCLDAIQHGLLSSAHDCSEGGLLVCIAESSLINNIGFSSYQWQVKGRLDTTFFGEAQSRILISVPRENLNKLEKIATKWQMPLVKLGITKGDKLVIKNYLNIALEKLHSAWMGDMSI